ncbi:hypothetical protein FKP32DRAFT_1644839 [Trametes sanguinea]|nr:hypothetical protein FKP32DRAFT_1644839 [Trametes sanguinea]
MTDINESGCGADIHRLHAAAHAFDPDVPDKVHKLTDALDELSSILAKSLGVREKLGDATDPPAWPILRRLWDITLNAHADPDPDDVPQLIHLSVSLARFTRNLVAAVPSNQQRAFENERAIRNLIYHYTSFNATQDPASYPATRMLSQALSNMVTGNDGLTESLWSTYLNLPEEQLVLTRLFASPDPRTVSSAFVLVLNCVHDSARRTELLVTSPRGPRICLTMLDRIASLFEAEESSEEGRAFDIGYEIFQHVIEAGLVAELYTRLTVDDEVVTPHQTTLLKLVDSYLHGSQRAHEVALARRPGMDRGPLFDVLTGAFLALSSYTQTAIEGALASGHTSPATESDVTASTGAEPQAVGLPPLQNLDLLLPKVCEALVLVTQCLTTVALRAEEAAATPNANAQVASESVYPSPKGMLVAATGPSGQGLVEGLIETLRLVDAFVPRITYGKLGAGGSDAVDDARKAQVAQAFAHVKRDLVRLLGILASENRAVQDRVRECGGIPVVMNLCVVDDYNPYMREHAIFALRNLLFGNVENQAVVDSIKPVGKWDEEKILREIRGD